MKKIFKIIAAALMTFTFLTACSNSNNTKTISVDDTAKAMVDATTLKAEIVEMSEKNVSLLYTKFDSEKIAEYKVYACASKASAEEVALFKAKSANDVDAVKEILNQRVADLITEFKDYNPNEMAKLQSPLITSNGEYIILVIADDTSPAQEAFKKAFN